MNKSGLSGTLLVASLLSVAVMAADDDQARAITLIDVNRDGYLDVVADEPAFRYTYLNDGFGRFVFAQASDASRSKSKSKSAFAGDVDRDGDADLIAISGGRAVLSLRGGTSGYDEQPIDAVTGVTDTAVALGDVDNDGDLDVVVFGSGGLDRLYVNRDAWGTCSAAAGACFDRVELTRESGGDSHAGALGDVDADGLLDLVVVDETHGKVYFGQPNGRDANPFTAQHVAFSRLSVAPLDAASKGMAAVAAYSPPPGHASCDPAVPNGSGDAGFGSSTKDSRVAKVGADQQVRDHGEPVVINLIGPTCLTVEKGVAFVDPGANAYTPVFGDLTDWIVVSNPVNTDVVGTYVVTYEVTDHDGYMATAWRTVFVENPDAPPPASDGGGGGSFGLELWSLLLIALARRRWKLGARSSPSRSRLPRA